MRDRDEILLSGVFLVLAGLGLAGDWDHVSWVKSCDVIGLLVALKHS